MSVFPIAMVMAALAATPPPFTWRDGDRVVLIGDTFTERAQAHGYLETIVTAANPGKAIAFRNLGWSGDTVHGHARAGFGTPADGFKALTKGVLGLKPTVLVVGYGMSESFHGKGGVPDFVSGLNGLLDALAPSRARVVLLSPIAHERLDPPLPDPTAHNEILAAYRDAVKAVAAERRAEFVDLYEATTGPSARPLTDNGIHPNALGHWYLASVIARALGCLRPPDALVLAGDGTISTSWPTTLSDVRPSALVLQFTLQDTTLPLPSAHPGKPLADDPLTVDGVSKGAAMRAGPWFTWKSDRRLRVGGLAPGRYGLRVDGSAILAAAAEEWARGVSLRDGPEFAQVEALRREIVAKDRLYFYRWRPQNETYLFGFRKHEQGNNAREVPLFDPLVEARERTIAGLKRPAPHRYELTREVPPSP